MPHITEEIWHTLTQQSPQTQVSLAQQIYPRVDDSLIDPALEQDFELLISTIRTVRNLRAEAGIKPGDRIEAILQTQDNREHRIFTAGWFYIKDLAKVKTLSISPPGGAQLQPVASTTLLRSRGSNKAWAEMTWVERLEIDEVLQLIGDFLMVYQRPLLVLGAIGVLALILAILKAVLDTVHQVPALPGFLEIVGLIYSIWYAKRNLWQLSDRQQFWQQIQHLRGEIVGQPRPLNSASTVEVASQAVAPEVGARRGAQPRSQMFAGVVGTTQVLIPLAGLVDVEVLQAKLERELTKVEAEVKTLAARLQNPNFVDKAPPEVVQGVRDTLAEAQVQSQLLRQRLERL
jgi:valyl-tRNA synthetase